MRLRLTTLLLTLALSLLAAPLPADAQRAGKVPKVGMLCIGVCSVLPHEIDARDIAFLQGLREAGYVLGQNWLIDNGGVGTTYDRLPALAARLVRRKVDVIVVFGRASAEAAKKATRTIPIVMVGVPDAVELGLVGSLARPGGNITGLTVPFAELTAKQLELLRQADPRVSRVAVFWNWTAPLHGPGFARIEVAARSLGVQVQLVEVQSFRDFESVFSAITHGRANGLLVPEHMVFTLPMGEITLFAVKSRLPTVASDWRFAQAGGLMSYGAHRVDLYRRAATFVGKILKGTKPADLPVEMPIRYELVISLSTAKALGLTIPDSLLFRADRVIR